MASKPHRSKKSKAEADDESAVFQTYFEYNRVLRTWFVAFGVGGPALFLINHKIAGQLAAAHRLRLVVCLFLAGTGTQVIGALVNKIANWYVYLSIIDDENPRSGFYSFAEWLSEQFWIDVIVDVLTIGAFGYAAWILLTVFADG